MKSIYRLTIGLLVSVALCQAQDDTIADYSALTPATGDLVYVLDISDTTDGIDGSNKKWTLGALSIYQTITPSANVQSILGGADFGAVRTLLDLEAGTDFYSIAAADAAFAEAAQGALADSALQDGDHWTTSGADIYRASGNIGIGTATPAAQIQVTGQSLTGSQATSLLDIASVWNTTGTPTALKLNVTDTASNASSNLMDLQVGGSSKFKVGKDGAFVTALNSTASSTIYSESGNTPYFRLTQSTGKMLRIGPVSMAFYDAGFANPVILVPDAAGILAQRNSTSAQESRIYNTFTDASNGEWLEVGFQDTSNTAVLKTNANGTGTARNITIDHGAANFEVANSLSRNIRFTSGNLQPTTNNSILGASSARWVTVYGADINASGYVKSGTYTVATLPAAATAGAGATAFVSDGSVVHAGNSGSIVAGSGANFVPVYSDATNWRIN
jgi:hypothetical protein